MRVLHVYSGNLFGGIETMLLACAEVSPADSGVEQEFALCFDERLASDLRARGRAVHLLGPVRMSRPVTAHTARRALGRLLRSSAFDVVVCHAAWSHAIFGGVVRRRGVRLAFWAHDRMTGRHWTERVAKHVPPDVTICNSRFTQASVAALYPGGPSAVVHPPARLTPPVRQRRYVRMSLDTPQSAVVIAQASRCEPWKGHRVLLDALVSMRDIPNWMWWVVGGAQRPHEHAFLAELRLAAERGGIADRVRWLGQRSDVATLLAAADLFCQPNLEPEPFGLSFVEALFAGLPVVSAEHGGVREIIDSTCGVLIPPGRVDLLSHALTDLVTRAEHRTALAQTAPVRARTVSEPIAQVRRLRHLLDGVADPLEKAG